MIEICYYSEYFTLNYKIVFRFYHLLIKIHLVYIFHLQSITSESYFETI